MKDGTTAGFLWSVSKLYWRSAKILFLWLDDDDDEDEDNDGDDNVTMMLEMFSKLYKVWTEHALFSCCKSKHPFWWGHHQYIAVASFLLEWCWD